MFEYAKIILPKVSFSRELFRKELIKCINWVEKDEVEKLHKWCIDNFGDIYPDLLEEIFSNIAA